MGVKLQLLLGLLLIFSKCDCEKNTTSFENLALEKLDSTNNVIEKLPKTDTQINLVNKDTQDKYFGNDTHKNKTREELNNESDRTGRKDNSRSIDIEKFESHDLQTNDYGSPDSQKFLENSIRRTSTKGYIDFSKFQLTTPRHFFDSKFKEAKQKLEQEYDDNTPEHLDDEINDDDYDHRIHIDKLIGQSKTKPNSTVDYKEKTKISRNNTIGDGSEYNELKVEKMHKININSSYNFTTYDEDYTETTSPKEKIETTSPRGFIATTRKSVTLTKPPTSQSNHILSNKIEAETIKAINFLTTDYSTTKRLKEDNDLLSKEQTVEENKIIPLDKSTESSIEINRNTTTEEINTSTEKTVNFDNATTTDQYEQTTVTFDQTTSTEYIETFKHDDNLETKNKIDSTTEYSTTVQDDIKTTTDAINTTDVPTTTIVTTTNDVIKQTTGYDYTTEQSILQEITTEFVNRISKSFAFESTHTQETTEPISATVTTSMDDITVSTTDTTNFVETTTKKIVMPKILEPTTTVLTTTEFEITLTPEITEKINLSTLPNTLPISHSSSSSTSSVPVLINVTEDTTIHITTDDSFESSSGTDTGNLDNNEDNKGKIAAIIISSVGAVCLILLAGLLYIMRKRQRRFNYKQRCRPVGLDDYSVDNVSGYNSTRRKAERQSKRSYGNPAFDDPVAVTHPLNFPALAKFAINTDDIKAEFEEIPQITARANELPEGCETKNRYANVIPLPETRVFLQSIDTYPNSDYINANYVTGPTNIKGYYIACQGPMSNTVDDFWRMVWEQQTKVILMLTHLFENGVEKCVDYLPPSEVLDCNRLFGDFQVTLKKRDVKEKYIISNLQLKNMVSNSWREITHFWYLGWPERGVPSEENSIIAFLIEARSYMKSATLDKTEASNGNLNGSSKNEINPVLVHCSPGTGRTGVVLACDIAIREFEKNRLVDIPKIVYRIRRDRASAVQTKEQYMFIYKVVSLYATKLTGGALESL